MLQGLGTYCNNWHLEVSSAKSHVLVYGQKTVKNRAWPLGSFASSTDEMQEISILEVQSVQYLGMTVLGHNDIFCVYKQGISSKIRKMKWLAVVPSERLGHQIWFGSNIWKTYIVPGVLHGIEALNLTATFLKELELGQNEVLRSICHLPQCTPVISL